MSMRRDARCSRVARLRTAGTNRCDVQAFPLLPQRATFPPTSIFRP